MNKMIDQANTNLKKAMEIFKTNENAFNSMNLKLYDAFFYTSDIEKDYPEVIEDGNNENDLFYEFCEFSYEMMLEDFDYEGWDFSRRSYIGRTSSFYLDGDYQLHKRSDMDDLLYHVVETFGYNDLIPDIKDGQIDLNDPYIEDADANIEYIASEDFINDLNKSLEPIIGMYNYIKCFKEHQVENFKGYLENIQDNIRYDRELQEKRDLEIWISGVEKIIA